MGLHNCNEDTVWQGELLLQEVRHEQEIILGGDYRSQDWVCEPGNLGPGWGSPSTPPKNPKLSTWLQKAYMVSEPRHKTYGFVHTVFTVFFQSKAVLWTIHNLLCNNLVLWLCIDIGLITYGWKQILLGFINENRMG